MDEHNNNDFENGAMKVSEAVSFSGIGRTRLYQLMNEGQLVSTRVGGTRLICRDSLRTLLQSGHS